MTVCESDDVTAVIDSLSPPGPAKPPRPIHRDGAVFVATFQAASIAPWLSDVGLFNSGSIRSAVVRCSAFVSLRRPFPEVLCLAVKLSADTGDTGIGHDGEVQDLLFFSSFARLHANAFPSGRWRAEGTQFSSAMSYRVGDQRILFGARMPRRSPARSTVEEGVRSRIASRILQMQNPASASTQLQGILSGPGSELEIVTATPGGRWWHAGTLSGFTSYGPWGDSVRFRRGHTCPELALTRFGAWRDGVYRYVQARP